MALREKKFFDRQPNNDDRLATVALVDAESADSKDAQRGWLCG